METQSKKDETKAKDRKIVFNLFFKRFTLCLYFCCFLILSLFSLHLVGLFSC